MLMTTSLHACLPARDRVARASRLAVAIALVCLSPVATLAADLPDPATLDRIEVRTRQLDAAKAEQALNPGGVTVVDGDTFYVSRLQLF